MTVFFTIPDGAHPATRALARRLTPRRGGAAYLESFSPQHHYEVLNGQVVAYAEPGLEVLQGGVHYAPDGHPYIVGLDTSAATREFVLTAAAAVSAMEGCDCERRFEIRPDGTVAFFAGGGGGGDLSQGGGGGSGGNGARRTKALTKTPKRRLKGRI